MFSKRIKAYVEAPRNSELIFLSFTVIIIHRKNVPKLNFIFVGTQIFEIFSENRGVVRRRSSKFGTAFPVYYTNRVITTLDLD